LQRRSISHMHGWYLQQFIKIQIASEQYKESIVLIWDADTVPLRPLNFIGSNGELYYFVGTEYHEPYFTTLRTLLNIDKLTPYSFIAQCIPLKASTAKSLIVELGGNDWVDNIMKSLSDGSDCLFSEYETIGNYVLANNHNPVIFVPAPWLRDGDRYYYKYGCLEKAINKLQYDYSYAAFEKLNDNKIVWEAKKIYGRVRRWYLTK
jgi:hypothetical protein